jgi:diguanylate cyclase (GGDEF)-like protein/PAS domain S-box-containing protein
MHGNLRPFPGANPAPLRWRFDLVIWLFAGVVACLLAAAVASVALLTQGQASLAGAAQTVLLFALLLLSGLLLFAGILVFRQFVAKNEELQRTLHANEAQMRLILGSAPLPLLILRASDHRLIYANTRGLQQFGLDADSTRERSLADFHADPATHAELAKVLARDGFVRDFEVEMKDRAGKRCWLLLSAQALRHHGEECLLVGLANIDDRKRIQDDMRRRAMHDPLTNLPNRAMFMEALERAVHKARRRAARFSILFVDLDRFKEVNDRLGHHAGDVLLQTVAERLLAAVRQSDLVARLAGDEFVVLVEEHGGPEEVMIVAQKVLSALQKPVTIDWREADVSGSIGIASFPEDGADIATLVRNADTAMYQAKERGRNNFQFYSAEMNVLSQSRFQQQKRIEGALERHEFFLLYQPEVDLETRRVTAVEALLRWRDPEAGVVSPADFLPLVEESGTINTLGRWILDRALRDLRGWHDAGLEVVLAVNVTARQLQNDALVDEVFQSLNVHRLEARFLRLEITETALMEDSDATHRVLRSLRGMGVQLAIDDFGTGYSSLGLVRGLPLQVVKIDRTLVSACPTSKECSAIVQAASAMARVLGIKLVAEGVENEEQRGLMQALGCDSMQGYLVARPVDAAGIAAMTRAAAEHTFLA